MEELAGIGINLAAFVEFQQFEIVLVKNKLVYAGNLFGNRLTGGHLVLLPAAKYLAVKAFDEPDIILGIVECCHILIAIEVVYHPALLVHIGEAERTFNLSHSFAAAIFHDLVEKGLADIEILYEIEPSKADSLLVPTFIDRVVYDCCHASHDLAVNRSKKHFEVAMFE